MTTTTETSRTNDSIEEDRQQLHRSWFDTFKSDLDEFVQTVRMDTKQVLLHRSFASTKKKKTVRGEEESSEDREIPKEEEEEEEVDWKSRALRLEDELNQLKEEMKRSKESWKKERIDFRRKLATFAAIETETIEKRQEKSDEMVTTTTTVEEEDSVSSTGSSWVKEISQVKDETTNKIEEEDANDWHEWE